MPNAVIALNESTGTFWVMSAEHYKWLVVFDNETPADGTSALQANDDTSVWDADLQLVATVPISSECVDAIRPSGDAHAPYRNFRTLNDAKVWLESGFQEEANTEGNIVATPSQRQLSIHKPEDVREVGNNKHRIAAVRRALTQDHE